MPLTADAVEIEQIIAKLLNDKKYFIVCVKCNEKQHREHMNPFIDIERSNFEEYLKTIVPINPKSITNEERVIINAQVSGFKSPNPDAFICFDCMIKHYGYVF